MTISEPFNYYEEKRSYPRVEINSPVTINCGDNEIIAEIHDISAEGMQIRCDRSSFQQLHPTGSKIRRENAPLIQLQFQLNANAQVETINVKSLVYYFVIVPDTEINDVAFGVRFISLDENSKQQIDTYLEYVITPEEEGIMDDSEDITDINPNSKSIKKTFEFNRNDLMQNDQNSPTITIPLTKLEKLVSAFQSLIEKVEEIENRVSRMENSQKNIH